MKKLVVALCVALVVLGAYTLKLRADVETARRIIAQGFVEDAKEMAELAKPVHITLTK